MELRSSRVGQFNVVNLYRLQQTVGWNLLEGNSYIEKFPKFPEFEESHMHVTLTGWGSYPDLPYPSPGLVSVPRPCQQHVCGDLSAGLDRSQQCPGRRARPPQPLQLLAGPRLLYGRLRKAWQPGPGVPAPPRLGGADPARAAANATAPRGAGTRGAPCAPGACRGTGLPARARPPRPAPTFPPGRAWQDFQARLGDEARFIPRKEQVSTLYQNINLVEPRLIQPYEHVIKNFIREIKLQSTEMESLAIAVKRAQDKAAMQLNELEEEMDQRIQAAEQKTRKDEKRKAEEALSDLRRQYETEVGDLQVTIKKLKKLEEQSKHINQKEDVAALKKQIYDLSMENQKVKKDLLEAQTNIAFLQSELDALKSDYADQSLNSERDLEIIREYTEDRNSLERQIEILQTANRKLHDSNDGLRSALERSHSRLHRSLHVNNISPGSTISRSTPKFSGHSPQPLGYDRSSRSSCMDEDCDSLALCDPMQRANCEVDSLPESCFDSGLSTLRDSNDYDSEVEYKQQRGFQRSHEVQESFGGDASDTDVPDIRDEETYDSEGMASTVDWKPQGSAGEDSLVTSSRKPISALSPQTDTADDNHKSCSQKAYKIVLAGDAAVGKSSFLMRLCKNEFLGNTSATLGVDFQMKTLIVDGERTVLQLWDTAGQERFRSIAKSYFRRADGVLLLYDVTCEQSFLHVREWVDMIEDAAHETIPIMLVGNKADLRDSATTKEQKCVTGYVGEKLAMTYGALFCETSAKDGSNIVEAVLHLAREVKKRTDTDDSKSITNLTGTSSKKSAHMKNCCNS
ncbi:PREDICTED: ras and EF-hand domain-containing protein [Galeopterus variegatus]|uniref:Ras and EF-hand domain-containing protein n=1 Tax=Galeopterus variegatus TaxID=482537 RepID=A0ABM0Q784_GALVR|nr:PREDICTED: ras and EF-hand domain-containing protein [Galeopterus variegatus]